MVVEVRGWVFGLSNTRHNNRKVNLHQQVQCEMLQHPGRQPNIKIAPNTSDR